MKNLHFISPILIAVFLIHIGCKGEEKPVSSFKKNASTEAAKSVQIEGLWTIDSLSLSSVTVPSFCHQIGEGATFEFTENNSLKVYPIDVSEPCEEFSYTAQQDFLHLVKDDMIMLVEYKLSTDRNLVLRSNSFFRWQEETLADSSAYNTLLDKGVTVFLSKK